MTEPDLFSFAKAERQTPVTIPMEATAEKSIPRESLQKSQKKSFTAHANLVYQAMTRQAGTLGKAILEGVMNSIDAQATHCKITLTQKDFRIDDDGKGMQTEQEIDEFFAVLGTPHETNEDGSIKDAKYGEYRMGRGQIFAQGLSIWRTGPFELIVDLKKWGLDFEQHQNPEPTKGCSIHTTLYEELSISDFQNANSEIKRFCKYVEIPVFLNDKQINTSPKNRKWTHEDETAYYQIEKSDTRQTGVELYQQGVYVERIPTWQDGINGVVVTKNRMTLNFARNQAMRNCPVYKAVTKTLRKFGERNTKEKSKRNLSLPERVSEILRAEGQYYHEFHQKKLFADVQGKLWSMAMLTKATRTFNPLPNGAIPLSFAEVGNRQADKIMEKKQGIVLDEEILNNLEVAGLEISQESFLPTFGPHQWQRSLRYVPLETLTKDISTSYQLVDREKLTEREKIFVRILQKTIQDLKYIEDQEKQSYQGYRRELRIGVSEAADGWTDGETYIVINRAFLQENQQGTQRNWGNLILLVIHEHCHQEDDTKTQIHSPEFYKKYHDLSTKAPTLIANAFHEWIKTLEKSGKNLPQILERAILQEKLTGPQETLEEFENPAP